ncbi:MAG: 30S ribosomal protein S18 [Candidatus Omnitrophota bacterium]|nr:30S ribosomal protein S18 [Candidatus Omnitrophota bacterium]
MRKKFCRFCQDKVEVIDYKDITRLSKFITERKKILSRRISGNCARHQRKISHAIKRARILALV